MTVATGTEANSGEMAVTPDGGATVKKAKKKARVE